METKTQEDKRILLAYRMWGLKVSDYDYYDFSEQRKDMYNDVVEELLEMWNNKPSDCMPEKIIFQWENQQDVEGNLRKVLIGKLWIAPTAGLLGEGEAG